MHNNLLKLQAAARDFPTAIKLFQEIDADNSGELELFQSLKKKFLIKFQMFVGELDKYELATLMRNIGLDMSEKRINEIMFTYDVDQGTYSTSNQNAIC